MPKSSKRTKRSTAAKTPTAPNSLTTLSVNTPEEAKLWVSCEYLLGDSYDQEAVEAAAFTVYGPKNRILVKDENWKITQLLAPRKLDDHERPRLFKAGVEGEAKWEKQRVGLKVTLNSWDEAAKNKEILEYVRAAVADTLREIWGARRDRYYFLVRRHHFLFSPVSKASTANSIAPKQKTTGCSEIEHPLDLQRPRFKPPADIN
ncbi:hypothetical protein B0T24DRAFT_404779 [Lasiosphaeria ovina]|uniref:Uncharacterized protein n=1 Tax=Lasiosphaeria ovina TaxID=92902 RepID=A0AAE0JXI3_9PEZI|nr:hypothetical protein B0T24DRAFT_404779 [Lasiosphaeria ovina]